MTATTTLSNGLLNIATVVSTFITRLGEVTCGQNQQLQKCVSALKLQCT